MKLFLSLSLLTIASAAVPSLTPENWDAMTSGKTVFIKYFAPWCGHCKAMKEDWEKLSDDWAGSESALIAEVDCTVDSNSPLCGSVQGYPTIKYGDPNSLEDYSGAREYDELAEFAKENLKPVCAPNKLENCTDEEKAEITKFDKLSLVDLEAAIAEVDGKTAEAEQEFEAAVDELQNKYDELMKSVEEKTAKMQKESGYKYMKAVLATKKPPSPAPDVEPMDDDDEEPDMGEEL